MPPHSQSYNFPPSKTTPAAWRLCPG